jgi:hypothetical protein
MKLTRMLAAIALACVASAALASSDNSINLKNTPIDLTQPQIGMPYPEDPAIVGGSVWVPDPNDNAIARFSLANAKQVGSTIHPEGSPSPRKIIADGAGSAWVFMNGSNYVYRYDAAKGTLLNKLLLDGASDQAAFGGGYIWAATQALTLDRIDPNNPTTPPVSYSIPDYGPVGFDGTYVWISAGSTLYKFDPSSGAVVDGITLSGATGTSGITFDGTYLWVNSDMSVGQVYQVDPVAAQVKATVNVYDGVHGSAFDGTLLWVVCSTTDSIAKIDVKSATVVDAIQMPAGSFPHDIAFDGNYMWVSANSTGMLYKYFAHF